MTLADHLDQRDSDPDEAAASTDSDQPTPQRRRFVTKIVAFVGFFVVASTVAAVAGALPDSAQHHYAVLIGKVSPLSLPDPNHVHWVGTPPQENNGDDKNHDNNGTVPTTAPTTAPTTTRGSGGTPTLPTVKPGDTSLPVTLTLTCAPQPGAAECSWTVKPGTAPKQFVLMRSGADGNWVIMAATDLTVRQFEDESVAAHTSYKYWMIAYGANDAPIGQSNAVDITTP